jgi:hypothetical protein
MLCALCGNGKGGTAPQKFAHQARDLALTHSRCKRNCAELTMRCTASCGAAFQNCVNDGEENRGSSSAGHFKDGPLVIIGAGAGADTGAKE